MTINIETIKPTLNEISDELTDAAHVDNVFWQIQAIIKNNPSIDFSDVFQDWLAITYIDSIAVRLRRLADNSRSTKSLYRFLENMKSYSGELTRSWYFSVNTGQDRDLVNKWFDEVAGIGQNCISIDHIESKQRELKIITSKICVYANEHIAHYAKKPTELEITFSDIRQSLAGTFRIFNWCYLALTSLSWTTPVPTYGSDWIRVFRMPWLEPMEKVPSYQHLDEYIKRSIQSVAADG
jgi:hypothetical protein